MGRGEMAHGSETLGRVTSMGDKYIAIVVFAIIAGAIAALPEPAHASLSGPPPSFVVPARDGKHILVMLSFMPIAKDTGNLCKLPNGKKVKLRDAFPSSGLYKLGSTTPIWTVDWYAESGYVIVSENGRYVVRINRFGGGGYGEGVRLRWGIRFYDAGVELRSYGVGELVDYPSLMAFSTYDWHQLWIDGSKCDSEIHNGFYHLCTSCREEYTFDVTTGNTAQEARYWRTICHRTIAALGVLGVVAGWSVYRVRKAQSNRCRKEPRLGRSACCIDSRSE